jgi:protein SCO1
MNHRLIQRSLRIAAGLAAAAYVVAFMWQQGALWGGRSNDAQAFRAEFELTDHLGMVKRDEDFAGKWLLVFFGFTNCPDVCPTTLSEVAAVMEGLGDGTERVQPLFVSIDPERDTPAALADFVPLFDAGIIGLTGTPDQIAATAKGFFVYYEKIEEAAAPGGYAMSHSSQLFLFDPQAQFVKTYRYGTSAEEILADLRERIAG